MPETPDQDFIDICQLVGVLTITWAWAENYLALALGIIDASIPAMRGHKEIPINLTGKISYLRNALADVPALQPLQQQGRLLEQTFSDLKDKRHNLIHGAAWQTGTDQFRTARFIIKGRKMRVEHKDFNKSTSVELGEQIVRLVDMASDFLFKVVQVFPEPN